MAGKKKISFEEAISSLEDIVSKLEDTNTSLENAMKFFEEGTKLVSVCYDKINSAKLKFTKLERGENSNGLKDSDEKS